MCKNQQRIDLKYAVKAFCNFHVLEANKIQQKKKFIAESKTIWNDCTYLIYAINVSFVLFAFVLRSRENSVKTERGINETISHFS